MDALFQDFMHPLAPIVRDRTTLGLLILRNIVASVIVVAMVLSVGCSSGSTPTHMPLSALELDFGKLDGLGPQSYGMEMTGKMKLGSSDEPTGTTSFFSTLIIDTSIDDDQIVMDTTLDLMGHQGKVQIRSKKNALLSPIQAQMASSSKSADASVTIKFADGKAVISRKGKQREIDFPPGTLTAEAIYRIVPLLPRKQGISYTFDAFTSFTGDYELIDKPDAGRPFFLTYQGVEPASSDNGQAGRHKYLMSAYASYHSKGKRVEIDRSMEFYVDDQSGRLTFMRSHSGTAMHLLDPEQIKSTNVP